MSFLMVIETKHQCNQLESISCSVYFIEVGIDRQMRQLNE